MLRLYYSPLTSFASVWLSLPPLLSLPPPLRSARLPVPVGCSIPPAVNQVEIHPYLNQERLVRFCAAHGVHVTAFSPLGSPSYVELGMVNVLAGGLGLC